MNKHTSGLYFKKPERNLLASITPTAVFAVPFADKKILFTKCIPTA